MEKILTDKNEIIKHKRMLVERARKLGWKNIFMYECGVIEKYTKVFVEAVRNFKIPMSECTLVLQGIIINIRDTVHEGIFEYRVQDGVKKVWRGLFEINTPSDRFRDVLKMYKKESNYISYRNTTYKLQSPKDGSVSAIPFNVAVIYDGYERTGEAVNRIIDHVTKDIVYTGLYFAGFSINAKLFVVEESPISKNSKGVIKKQSNNKSLYRIMHVSDIRKHYINRPEQCGSKLKVGFERRRHLHTFRSSRFVNMQGKTIWYPSVWVGPKSTIIDNRLIFVHTEISCDK